MARRSIPFVPTRTVVTFDGSTDEPRERAIELAQRLRLELIQPDQVRPDTPRLVVTDRRIELRVATDACAGPVYVDLIGTSARFGRSARRPGKELIVRAVGLKGGPPFVVDATAGFAGDAIVLARLGCRVHAIERSDVVAALVQDGIRRARDACRPELNAALTRLTLQVGDAHDVLTSLSNRSRRDNPTHAERTGRLKSTVPSESGAVGACPALDTRPDVVYLDPMYPFSGRTALNRKELRALRRLVGDDTDSPALFSVARRAARRRVVVKRPRHAPVLAPRPDIQYKGSSVRFDVYITTP